MMKFIRPRYLVPVRPRGKVFEDWAVVIDSDCGEIVDCGAVDSMVERFPSCEQVVLPNHVLLPGLINMHTHSPMTLLRGFADDLKLDDWLKSHIWPAEQRWADGDFVADGTKLALVEMLRSGTTCFNENYFFPDRIAAETDRAGCRAVIGIPVIGIPTAWARGIEEYIDKGLNLEQEYRDNARINFSFAPHALYSVPGEAVQEIVEIAKNLGLKIHLHLLETAWEIEHAKEQGFSSPLDLAASLGVMGPQLIAVHMVHLTDKDMESVAASGANVVHCPHSNLKLGSGICRLAELLEHDVNVCVGTDGAAGNNSLSMFDEVRSAALLAKGYSENPEVVDAMTALEMATINGAYALGMQDTLGSIEPGKQADLCAVDLSHARTQPLHGVISQLVYAAPGHQVSDVWVAGQRVLEENTLTTLDEAQVLARASQWAQKIQDGLAQ